MKILLAGTYPERTADQFRAMLPGHEIYTAETQEQYDAVTDCEIIVVRVLKTPLVQRVLTGGKEKFSCPYRCLRSCDPRKSLFCIARALLATWSGDVENGLYMTGCNINSVKKIYPIKEFFDTLKD